MRAVWSHNDIDRLNAGHKRDCMRPLLSRRLRQRALQKCLGDSKKDDERQREKPRAASTVTELVFKVFDDELVVRHISNQPDECQGVHGGGMFVVDVKSEEAVDEEIGGMLDEFVAVRDAA